MEPIAPQTRPPSKRRKLRKGTFSCTECKQRKRRCELPAGHTECVGCRRRGLSCVSQEYDVDENTYQGVQGSIARVEGLVAHLMRQRQGQAARPYVPSPGHLASGRIPDAVPRMLSGESVSVTTYLASIFPSSSEISVILCNSRSTRIPSQMLWASAKSQTPNKSERPPSGAHPIWFGRSLMQLALCLQDSDILGNDGSRFADIVSRNITSLDVMIDSVEGIEVLMLEAIYHVNRDNRRVAWLKCRRAISIAQMLGMDRGGTDEYAQSLWFRLLYGDRIISLELGLPHTILETDLEDDMVDPARRLESAHVSLSARIVARNLRMQKQDATYESKETLDIERRMKRARRRLPAGWWSVISHLCALAEDNAMAETARLTTQMNHFWILLNLYQPYLADALLSPNDSEEMSVMQSKAIVASREVLNRFIPLRKYHQGAFYHGLDFKAYSACINLLLGHILGHRRCQHVPPEKRHRQRDLQLIREVLEYLDDQRLSEATGLTVHDLLHIESTLASGSQISWERGHAGGKKLHIPFVGSMTVINYGGSLDGCKP